MEPSEKGRKKKDRKKEMNSSKDHQRVFGHGPQHLTGRVLCDWSKPCEELCTLSFISRVSIRVEEQHGKRREGELSDFSLHALSP